MDRYLMNMIRLLNEAARYDYINAGQSPASPLSLLMIFISAAQVLLLNNKMLH